MTSSEQRLLDLLAEFERRQAAGQPIAAGQLAGGDPELSTKLQAAIDQRQSEGRASATRATFGAPTDPMATVPGQTACAASPPPDQKDQAADAAMRRKSPLGPYELLEMLGKGGMGAVFKARHTRLNKFVAIKVLPENLMQNTQAVARFDREMKAVGALEHPNIVRAMDANEHQGTHYLVMEYVDGEDLQRFVRKSGTLSVPEACRLIHDAAKALDYAHRYGLVHRDIKPSNLLITKAGQLKVLDLGLARLASDVDADDGLTNTGASLGTPDYMAPEQWNDSHTVDHRTDLYALGCTLYYLLVGRAPYGTEQYRTVIGKMTAHAQGIIPSLREARPDVPAELDALYQHLLAKQVEDRIATAAELVKRIEPFCLAPIPVIELSGAVHVGASAATVTMGPVTPSKSNAPTATVNALPASATTTSVVSAKPSGYKKSLLVGGLAFVAAALVTTFALNRSDKPGSSKPETANDPSAVVAVSDHPKTAAGWYGWPADAPPPAIAPFDAAQAKVHQESWAKHLGVPVEYTNSIGMKFRLIPPGEFMMGSTEEQIVEALRTAGEDQSWQQCIRSGAPQHRVILTRAFYMCVHEVRHKDYRKVIGEEQSQASSKSGGGDLTLQTDLDNHPADSVTWLKSQQFCIKLSEMEQAATTEQATEAASGRAGAGYNLPTEAQWEFSCRAGTTSRFWNGDDKLELFKVGWLHTDGTREVCQLPANPFGLCDVYGNVWEWVRDRFSSTAYSQNENAPAIDPSDSPAEPSTDDRRVIRGGLYWGEETSCFSSSRGAMPASGVGNAYGFRVTLSVEAVQSALRQQPAGENVDTPPAHKPLEPLNLTTSDSWLNVLPLVNLQRDGFAQFGKNAWRVHDGELCYESQPGDEWGIMRLPAEIDSSHFKLKLRVDPLRGSQTLRIDLPVDGNVFSICFFETPFDHSVRVPMELDVGKPTTITLEWIRTQDDAQLVVEATGKPKFEWQGNCEVESHDDYLPHTPQVRLLCWRDSAYRFQSVAINALQGQVRIDDQRATTAELPNFVRAAPVPGLLPRPAHEFGKPRWQALRRTALGGDVCAWSSDGKSIAVSDYQGTVRITNAQSSEVTTILTGPKSRLSDLRWQPGGQKLLGTESRQGYAWLWDTSTGVCKQVYSGNPHRAAWSYDGQRFVTGGSNGDETVRCWTQNGDLLWAKTLGYNHDLSWSRDGKQIFFSTFNGLFTLSANDGAATRIEGPTLAAEGRCQRIACHPHDDVIAIGRHKESDENYVELWNYRTKELAGSVLAIDRQYFPESIAFSPDGKLLAFTTHFARAEVFDATVKTQIRAENTDGAALSASWSPDSSQFVFSEQSYDPSFRILSIDREKPMQRFGVFSQSAVQLSSDQRSYSRHGEFTDVMTSIFQPLADKPVRVDGYAWGLDWTPDGKHALAWAHGSEGMLVEPMTGKVVTRFKECSGQEDATAWSVDGELLAAAGYHTPLINVWKRDGSKLRSIEIDEHRVLSLAISPNKKWLAAGFRDEGAKVGSIWNLETGEKVDGEIDVVDRDHNHVRCLHWLSDGELLAGHHITELPGAIWRIDGGKVERVRNTPNARFIVRRDAPANPWLIASANPTAIVLKSLDDAETRELQAHGASISGDMLNVIDDGAELSLHCNDHIIRTWDSLTGELKRLLVLLANDQAITFDPAGKVLWQTAEAEKELIYVVEQPSGSLKMHTPEEFRAWAAK